MNGGRGNSHQRNHQHADDRGRHAPHHRLHPRQLSDAIEHGKNRQHDDERRQEGCRRRDDRAGEAGELVAHVRGDHQHRAGRQLSECQAIDELARSQPSELPHDLILDERDHRQPAADGERAHLEKEQAEVNEIRGVGRESCGGRDRRGGRYPRGESERRQEEQRRDPADA